MSHEPYASDVLPSGVRSRLIEGVNGLTVHVLEAGFESPHRPLLLLFHGFPELAYSWRQVMPALAEAGYHVVAPDVRGYGRTDGTDVGYDDPIAPYSTLSKVRDAVALVAALGHDTVAAAIGHDAGAAIAAWCGLIRPDMFRSVAMMSAPFAGAPRLVVGGAAGGVAVPAPARGSDINDQLALLSPPRQDYRTYYSSREANAQMWHAPQGLHAFLRGYYHHKSADWPGNRPHPLAAVTAADLAQLPKYYVMDLGWSMAETVAAEMPTPSDIARCGWLPDAELAVYAAEYGRTGFQGGLQGYRCGTSGFNAAELALFAGRTLDVPATFISGAQDWGNYQGPGALERMRDQECTDFRGVHLVDGAGHWVQQEQPAEVSRLLLEFMEQFR